MTDDERKHCNSVAWELMGVFDKPSTDKTLRAVADRVARERAAARAEAMEAAAAGCEAYAARVGAQWSGSIVDAAGHIARAIRALKEAK